MKLAAQSPSFYTLPNNRPRGFSLPNHTEGLFPPSRVRTRPAPVKRTVRRNPREEIVEGGMYFVAGLKSMPHNHRIYVTCWKNGEAVNLSSN